MSANLHADEVAKLSTLVESDFDELFLLQMIAREPAETLYHSVYKALYAEAAARADSPRSGAKHTTAE